MGYMCHHTLIVSGWQDEAVEAAHAEATRLCEGISGAFGTYRLVTPIVSAVTNGYRSFAVVPDGSKEGWDASDEGDAVRDQLSVWLRDVRRDKEWWLDWVLVQFGDEEGNNRVLAASYPDNDEGGDEDA